MLLWRGDIGKSTRSQEIRDKSLLMTAIQWKDEDYEMPPKENDRLSEEQIGWMREMDQARRPLAKSSHTEEIFARRTGQARYGGRHSGQNQRWLVRRMDLQALQARGHVGLPKPRTTGSPDPGLNPVDSFVRAKLNQEKVKPAPTAHFRDLVKRALPRPSWTPSDSL